MKQMKKWIVLILVLCLSFNTYAKEEPEQLYAQSAVLMDAESGRVLFEKNGMDVKAMASTTKIMTCILALEYGNLEEMVDFSANAARQPKVHLGALEHEQFYLKDLLYSLMLESHNDSAVAIAEAISGSVEDFAVLMNEKAKEIGCENTYFITPNGLDASDENGRHSTTAIDLAKIMSYCIMRSPQREKFLEITSTPQYSFTNLEGKRTYSCTNYNAFLNMMEEAISGKTGYTSEAGYCYVGAVESDGRTYVVSLLACGWPNNKTYKWSDMRELVTYGMEEFSLKTVEYFPETESVKVADGIPKSGELFKQSYISTEIIGDPEEISVLGKQEEKIEYIINQKETMEAPVAAGTEIGSIKYFLNENVIAEFPIVTAEKIQKKDFAWCLTKIFEIYIML